MNYFFAIRRIIVFSVVAVATSLVGGGAALAQDTPTVAYDLDFTTDYDLLMDPGDTVAGEFAIWKTPAQLAALHSAPMIRLTNRSSSLLDIESLRIDMGLNDYLFDSFAFLEQPDNGNAVLASHSDMSFGGDMQSFVELDIPNGLAPGDSVAFQVRIVGTASNALANYENVLWQTSNALFAADRTDNALITVTYRDDDQLFGATGFTPAQTRLFEYPLANSFFDTDTDGASGLSNALEGEHVMQTVVFARYSQAAIVPEPGTGFLALAAIIGCCGFVRRRRSR